MEAIKQEQSEFFVTANSYIITIFVRTINDRSKSDVYSDSVRTILSKVNTDLLEGTYDTTDWLDKPWLQQAIQVHVQV